MTFQLLGPCRNKYKHSMKRKLFPVILCLFLSLQFQGLKAQDVLVDFTYLTTKTRFDLFGIFFQLPDYDVDLYKLRYKTLDVHGALDTASGLLVLPKVPANTALPMVVYDHGTTNGPNDVPSRLSGGYEVAMAYAAYGFATVAPDYLGLGDARGFHTYVHAATEASASLDMLFAGLEYLELNDPDSDPNFLFLAGYSQGGHASMALHKEIDDLWSIIIPVTAATHMSGPYSISGVMLDKILSDESYGTPSYIAYTMLSYQEAYGNLYDDIGDLFKQPYATSIESFYNGNINLSTLNAQLIAALAIGGDTINKRMFHDSILEGITTNPNHPILLALQDNDTYNWAPDAPTRLYYCGADEQVPFQNSLVAEAEMQALGAPDVQAINLNAGFTHGLCVFPAIQSSVAFFRSFVNPSAIEDQPIQADELVVFPNPAIEFVVIDWDEAESGMEYKWINVDGQTVGAGYSPNNTLAVHQLPRGIYMLSCTVGNETRVARVIHP